MPKQKTRRSAAKRFRLTGTGKIRLNNSTQNSATAGYIDATDDATFYLG